MVSKCEDADFPSEAKRQDVFNRVSARHPNKTVKFMHGPFNRLSRQRQGDIIIGDYIDNRNDHPKGTSFLSQEGIGFALEPK
tara:strand:- start:1094 stop:1339 length:246 start_codon:yes stop_codon:yes gene_type:complete